MGWESSVGGLEALMVQPGRTELVLLLTSGLLMGGRSPWQLPLVMRGAGFSHPRNFGPLLSMAGSGAQDISGTSVGTVPGL